MWERSLSVTALSAAIPGLTATFTTQQTMVSFHKDITSSAAVVVQASTPPPHLTNPETASASIRGSALLTCTAGALRITRSFRAARPLIGGTIQTPPEDNRGSRGPDIGR